MKKIRPIFAMLLLAVMAFTFNSCQKEDRSVSLVGTWVGKLTPNQTDDYVIQFQNDTKGELWEEANGTIKGTKMAFSYRLVATTLTIEAGDSTVVQGIITTLNDRELAVSFVTPNEVEVSFIKR